MVVDKDWRIKRGWMELMVTDVVTETHDTKTFIFEDPLSGGRAFDYKAGQYWTFRYYDIETKPIVRSYTMSSAPCDTDHIAVTVKRVAGGVVSNWMCDELRIGSKLRARGPIGKFIYDAQVDQNNLIVIAAGSGVTPFVSILKDLVHSHLGVTATLLVAFRTRADIICQKELEWLATHPGIRIQMTFSREDTPPPGSWKGRIDESQLGLILNPAPTGTTYMTCGPDDMMEQVVAHLRKNGIPENCIKMESFAS